VLVGFVIGGVDRPGATPLDQNPVKVGSQEAVGADPAALCAGGRAHVGAAGWMLS